MPKVHNFHESLEESHKYADAPWWGIVYRAAFGGLAGMANVRNDGWAQRGGIDRVLTLSSGKTLNIDEKVRKKAWPDFALERWSDMRRQTPGWVQKDLATDFIAYAFVPTQECYLLPFASLRAAWRHNGRAWIAAAENEESGYSFIEALNHGYTTQSVGVPIPVVLNAIRDAMFVSWREAA